MRGIRSGTRDLAKINISETTGGKKKNDKGSRRGGEREGKGRERLPGKKKMKCWEKERSDSSPVSSGQKSYLFK